MKRRASVIFTNSLSTYARMGLGMIISLLITRTALNVLAGDHRAAKEIFGIFMLLTSITATVQFLSESTQKALVRFLAISIHNQDDQATQRLFNSGWLMNTTIGMGMAIFMVALSPWLVASFNVPLALATQAQHVIWLLAFSQAVNSIFQPWGAAFVAEERYAIGNILILTQQVMVFIGINLLHFIPVNALVGLALVWVLPNMIVSGSLAVWLSIHKPFLRLGFQYIRWEECKQLFSLGGWSSLTGFASNLYERTDQIIINLLLGPVFNAAYSVVIQLGNSIVRLVTALTEVLLPTASKIAANGSVWEKQQLIIRTTQYVLTLAVPCGICITIFRQEIIELWLGKGFSEAVNILPLTIFLILCRIPIFVTGPYLTATNQLKWPALAMLLDGVINVILSVLYVKAFNLGLAGVVLGTLSTNLVRFTFFQIPFVARLIELPLSQYWKRGFAKPVLSIVWLVPTLWFIHWLHLSSIATILLLVLTGVVYAAWVWLFVFDSFERKLFLGIVERLLHKNLTQNS